MRELLEEVLRESGWNKADGLVNKAIRIKGVDIIDAEWLGGELLGYVNGRIRNLVKVFEENRFNKTIAKAGFTSILRPE